MTRPISTASPRLATRDLLRELLTARAETYAQGVTVSTKEPPLDDGVATSPWVRISTDGSFRNTRLNTRATVRVVVWHRDAGSVEALALLCEALLLSASGHGIRNFGPLTGLVMPDGGDPDTGAPMGSFTLTARLQPIAL